MQKSYLLFINVFLQFIKFNYTQNCELRNDRMVFPNINVQGIIDYIDILHIRLLSVLIPQTW